MSIALREARLGMAAGLRPEPELLVSEWADAHRMLPQQSSAEPGPWRTERTPYLREIMDCLSPSSPVQTVVLNKASQMGGSEVLLNGVGFAIDHAPGPILVAQPTLPLAKRFSRQRLAPLLELTPRLREKVAAVSRNSGSSLMVKEFPGGLLLMAGASSAVGLRSMPIRWLFADELDGWPEDVDDEGDPMALAEARQRTFARRKCLKVSTPTFKRRSRIEAAYLASDQRRYYVPCPACGAMQPLEWPRVVWTKLGRPPERAGYECRACGAIIEDHQKTEMLAAGEWRPEKTGTDPRVRGYHISALYAPVGWLSWGEIAQTFVRSHRNPLLFKVFVNTMLGETWEAEGEAPDWEQLMRRRSAYPIGTAPHGVLFLVCGVDVQRDRLIYEVVGYGRGKTSWSIDFGTLPGDTADLERGPWPQIDALLARSFRHEGGADLRIRMLAVDAGDQTQTVYSWARQHPMNQVIAVKGQSLGGVLIGSPTAVDVTLRGRKLTRGYKVWPVVGSIAKSELYGWLRLQLPADGQGPPPPGFCHFPSYGEDYFRQLSAEQLVVKKTGRGFVTLQWELISGRDNHALDCFDAETEVLTREGWLRFAALKGEERLATVNLPGDSIEYQTPSALLAKPYEGPMLHLSGRRLDILVTPGHRMVTYRKRFDRAGGRWDFDVPPEITRAKDLTLHHMLKCAATWPAVESEANPFNIDPGEFAEFLGWYVAEGYAARNVWRGRVRRSKDHPWRTGLTPRASHVVGVCQRLGAKRDHLGALLRRLPWRWRSERDKFVTSSKALYEYLEREVGHGAENKRVPQWVKDAPPKVIARFVDAAILGDGWVQQKPGHRPSRTYATVSRRLADDMQELFIKLGRTANIRIVPAKPWRIEGRSGSNTREQYHVSECKAPRQYLVRRGIKGVRKSEFIGAWRPYVGMVYCATVPNGTLICRRNGRAFIAGNCRVYARAAAALLGLDRFQESDWAALELAVGQAPKPPDEPPPAAAAAAARRPAPPPVLAARQPWISRRPDWLRNR